MPAIHLLKVENGRIELTLLAITAVFVFANAIALSLVREKQIMFAHLWAPHCLAGAHARCPPYY